MTLADYIALQWAILREHGLIRDSKGSKGVSV